MVQEQQTWEQREDNIQPTTKNKHRESKPSHTPFLIPHNGITGHCVLGCYYVAEGPLAQSFQDLIARRHIYSGIQSSYDQVHTKPQARMPVCAHRGYEVSMCATGCGAKNKNGNGNKLKVSSTPPPTVVCVRGSRQGRHARLQPCSPAMHESTQQAAAVVSAAARARRTGAQHLVSAYITG